MADVLLRQAKQTSEDSAEAVYSLFRIISSSVRLDLCCVCCSMMILPEIEHRQQVTCNVAMGPGSEATKGETLPGG